MSTDPAPYLHLPHGLNYECIRCGRSCGEFWEIPVDPEMSASIRALPLDQLQGVADPTRPVVESPWTPGQDVMRLCGGVCAMRDNNNLCAIHARFGFDAKPNICRSFPYRFVETPGGVNVGLSFACSAVLGNLGPAVSGQRAELEHLYDYTHSRRSVSEPLQLTPDLPLSWAQYEAVEADLLALLELPDMPLGRRLLAQSIYLRLLVNFLRQGRDQAGALTAGPEANEELLRAFRRGLEGTPPDPWPRLRAMAGRQRRSPLFRRMFLGFAHALRNTYGRRRGRLRSYLMVTKTYFGYAFGRGVLDLPILRRPVSYRELRGVRFDPERPEHAELLTRYFRHALLRKDLLLADAIHLGHHMQLMHWGLIHWYAAALAASDGRGEVEPADLTESLRNVEKYYVFHSTFNNLFSRYPLLRYFLDRLFDHPLYAFTMSHGES